MTNELVQKPQDDGKIFTGAGLLDTGEDLVRNFSGKSQAKDDNGNVKDKELDEVALAIDGIAMGLGLVGAAVDPLGTLAASVVGWIIENVSFVRKPFDDLAGDPPAIEAVANTWTKISERLNEVAGTYETSRGKIADWEGGGADAYGKRADALVAHLKKAATSAEEAATAIKLAGAAVAATRALIRDVLAELAATLITWGIPAAAAAVPTAGASIAAFITRAVTKAIQIGGKIAQFLKKLFTIMDKLSAVAKRMGAGMRGRADELADMARMSPNTPAGNQRAGELLHASSVRNARADRLDNLGDNLANGANRGRDSMDNITNRANDIAQNWNRRVGDWADRVKQNGPNRKQRVQDLFNRIGSPPPNTRSADMPDPTHVPRPLSRFDNIVGNGIIDGQNWARAARTFDIGHLMPAAGDLISPTREGLKELNKGFWADDVEKSEEKDRDQGNQVFLPYRNRDKEQ
ncbi:hypothetical protein [Saccharothrix sp.]|uniref:hypothetical protein n=1 Tax=Saccharothrix sp. TaxID=1873460 RepID=UPI002811F185|nr:hypothetical protein [Saccharothrix sp.]